MTTSPDLPTCHTANHAYCESNKEDSPTESLFPNPSPTGKGGVGGNPRPSPDEHSSSPKKPSRDGEHPRFAEWYAAYPVHKARGAAVRAFTKAAARADPQALIDAAKRYRDDPQVSRGYGKFPATWLNQDCWLDEPTPDHAATGTDGRPDHGAFSHVNAKWANGQEIDL